MISNTDLKIWQTATNGINESGQKDLIQEEWSALIKLNDSLQNDNFESDECLHALIFLKDKLSLHDTNRVLLMHLQNYIALCEQYFKVNINTPTLKVNVDETLDSNTVKSKGSSKKMIFVVATLVVGLLVYANWGYLRSMLGIIGVTQVEKVFTVEKGCVVYDQYYRQFIRKDRLVAKYVFTFDNYGRRARLDEIDPKTGETKSVHIWDAINNKVFNSGGRGKWDLSDSGLLNTSNVNTVINYDPFYYLTHGFYIGSYEMPDSELFISKTSSKMIADKLCQLTTYSTNKWNMISGWEVFWTLGYWEDILMYKEGVENIEKDRETQDSYISYDVLSVIAKKIDTNVIIPDRAFEDEFLKVTWTVTTTLGDESVVKD